MRNIEDIQKELFALGDAAYREMQIKIIPNVPPDKIIGVRIPVLRKYAAKVYEDGCPDTFFEKLPHDYFDENNLHACLIEKIKDFDIAVKETERFLPYVDNWATCDIFAPKVFGKNKERLLLYIKKWIKSGEPYTVRYGIGMLMRFYLDEDFKDEYASIAASVKSDEYYVKMMVSWYFATALAKQYDSVINYITEKRLDPWVHNKAIQKAIESRRIEPEVKMMLKTYKIRRV